MSFSCGCLLRGYIWLQSVLRTKYSTHSMTLTFSTSSPFRPMAPVLEFVRCIAMMVMHRLGYMMPLLPALTVPTEVRSPALWHTVRRARKILKDVALIFAYGSHMITLQKKVHLQIITMVTQVGWQYKFNIPVKRVDDVTRHGRQSRSQLRTSEFLSLLWGEQIVRFTPERVTVPKLTESSCKKEKVI